MSKWHYLGHSIMSYINAEDEVQYSTRIHAFVSRINDRRSIHVEGEEFPWAGYWDRHPGHSTAKVWASGEDEIYAVINKLPSRYLKAHMLEKYKNEWDSVEKQWTVASDIARYTQASEKQTKIADGNIIKIDFQKP